MACKHNQMITNNSHLSILDGVGVCGFNYNLILNTEMNTFRNFCYAPGNLASCPAGARLECPQCFVQISEVMVNKYPVLLVGYLSDLRRKDNDAG